MSYDDLKINLHAASAETEPPAEIAPILQAVVIPSRVREVRETEQPLPVVEQGSLTGSNADSRGGVQTLERQPSMRPSPVSGVTPPVHTRWKKGQSGNPGGRARHVSRAYIKHLETVVDEETGETNADKIAKAQIRKAYSEKDDGSTAAAREIRQATETDDEANKGGVSIGNLNMAIIQQIQRAATGSATTEGK